MLFFKTQCFRSVSSIKCNIGKEELPLFFSFFFFFVIKTREDFYIPSFVSNLTWCFDFFSFVVPQYQIFLEGWEIYDLA